MTATKSPNAIDVNINVNVNVNVNINFPGLEVSTQVMFNLHVTVKIDHESNRFSLTVNTRFLMKMNKSVYPSLYPSVGPLYLFIDVVATGFKLWFNQNILITPSQ